MCPIHCHLLLLISSPAGTLSVLCQSSVANGVRPVYFEDFARQEFMKVCTFLVRVFVVRHVSAPYNRTDFTFELKSRIFVWVLMVLDRQTFFRVMNAALAFPILHDICVCSSLLVDNTPKVCESFYFLQVFIFQFDCLNAGGIDLHNYGIVSEELP